MMELQRKGHFALPLLMLEGGGEAEKGVRDRQMHLERSSLRPNTDFPFTVLEKWRVISFTERFVLTPAKGGSAMYRESII